MLSYIWVGAKAAISSDTRYWISTIAEESVIHYRADVE
jgi:hypothetical protein